MKVNVLVYITLMLLGWGTYTMESYGYAKRPQGTIQEAEFIIKKEKKNQLPEADRLIKKAPLPLPTEQPSAELQYALYDIPLDFQSLEHKIKILRSKQERLINLYGKYLKLGYGNYHMPYIAAFFNNTRNKRHGYGLHISHLSEGKKKYAEEHHNTINFHGKKLMEKLTLAGSLDYNWDKYPFKQLINNTIYTHNDPNRHYKYHQVQLRTSLYNHLPSTLKYQVHTQLIHLSSSSSIHETQEECKLHASYSLNEIFQLRAGIDIYLSQYRQTNNHALQRNIFRFKPIFVTKLNEFIIQTGTTLTYQNNTDALPENFHVYPEVKLTYALNKAFRPYIGVSGNIQANSWQEYILQNPWLASTVDLRHTNQQYICYAGIKSDILSKLTCHAGLSISSYKNWYCFVNNATEPRQFDIQYDAAAKVMQLFAELAKTSFGEALVTRLKAAYFDYTLTQLEKPWHKPQYTIEILNTYNFHDKILLKGNLHWLGGIQALDPTTKAAKSLPDVIDIDLGIEYVWNQRFTIFLDCSNILARSNNRYLHAPTSGAHFLAGVTYAW
ncbi:hypothetical protein Aasi_1449 [Candidatus Amoebophilus asiaticus 5a2]|uniref:TonB-dependent receptor-like beta-barrel domain-containing protein n=1 Tax=Amoebophilus asiaticus (strain 5a2) TaxID=452471 RepID=B3EU36_AMOA5|nr:hypothetical protein [Candidatus Amoebophilus asiaticus]ACE06738.1 hypothetical protein Aasi_1449 [Candidatus Amoebophilus asiaticus 5a2]